MLVVQTAEATDMDRQDRHKCMAEAQIHQESLIHPSKLCEKRQSQAWAMCRKVMMSRLF